MVEAKGNFASRDYFYALINTEQENINKLSQEYYALQNSFNEAMNTGTIEKYSEAWYEMQEKIRDVKKAWEDARLSLVEYQNQMREMDWSIFEKMIDYQSELTSESDFIRELLALNENDLFVKETGHLSNKGQAVGGLHAVDYNVYMAQADEYRKKVEELNKELEKDPHNTILIDKRNEYLEAQRESILNAKAEKEAVKDLIADSYERMLDILQEMIDKRKEFLQTEKDAYDYQNSIKDQTKTIKDYEKQLSALKGDNSEETKAKKQQLQTSLEDAKQQLEETEYEKWLSDQEKLLDKLYSEYEEILNARLDNIDGLMTDMINNTNEKSDIINQSIKEVTSGVNGVGYTVTSGMQSIWDNTSSGIGKVVTDYSANFTNQLTTTNNYMKSIHDLIGQIVNKSVKEIESNTGGVVKAPVSSSSSTTTKPTTSNTTTNKNSNNNSNTNKKGWFFVYKKDSFQKSQLNINESIVDRIKYHDFDPSWNNMKNYYEGMGLGSASSYTGSYTQNVNMLNWMKKNGFKKSGTLESMVKSVGEEGLFLGRNDDHVLARDDWMIASKMTQSLINYAKQNSNSDLYHSNNTTSISDINLNITLPNVKNYESFKKELQNDSQFEKMIQSMTVGKILGGNSLNKHKFK